MVLAQHWQRQGRRQEAYDLVAPIFGWFTQGFDTPDLQKASSRSPTTTRTSTRCSPGRAFDLLVNLTDMQEHERLNRQAIEAGKHVWSEKPMANSLAAGQALLDAAKKKGVRIWGAPAMVVSPQFAFMAKTLAAGKLGRVAAAHADYGHTGPDWSAFFYEKGGGSLPDLAVYNLTTLTGLLGPAKAVVAMTSVVTPTRQDPRQGRDQGRRRGQRDGPDGPRQRRHLARAERVQLLQPARPRRQQGAAAHDHDRRHGRVHGAGRLRLGAARAWTWRRRTSRTYQAARDRQGRLRLADGGVAGRRVPGDREGAARSRPEHALHVLEVIQAARESQDTGRRVALRSTFPWPVVS